ncbi:MAG: hypothetical protein VKP62_04650 [Candidatus Sericytochromatia bacterium]|nr:hypothetical protein [Candidatus Sericytochromatia bacterium]
MSNVLFPQFATQLRTRWLKDLVDELLAALRNLDLPMIQMLAMLPEDKAKGWLMERMESFLTAVEAGQALQWEMKRLAQWESGEIPGIPKNSLHPTDVPLYHSAQRAALQKFVGRFSRDPNLRVELLAELEGHFQSIFAEAMRTHQRLKMTKSPR